MPTYATGHVRHPAKDVLMALSAKKDAARMKAIGLRDLPPSYDARNDGIVPPIKNQASCGSCWDFSGTAVVEITLIKAGILTVGQPLSEQYTLSCGRNGGCNGDDNVTVLQDAKSHGLPLTADYGPYTSGSGGGGSCKYNPQMKLYTIDDWGFADGNQGQGVTPQDAIKAAIFTYGSVGAAIAADNALMNNPRGKVFKGNSRSINHDIVLIGWDDAKGEGGKTAWILRNSWGLDFCDDGYCFILAGANAVGTEAVWAKKVNPNPPPPPFIDWASL